jgi:hypothetical protein
MVRISTERGCKLIPDDRILSVEYNTIFCKSPEQKEAISNGTLKASDIPESEMVAKVVLNVFYNDKPIETDERGNPKPHDPVFFTPADFAVAKPAIDALMVKLDSPSETVKRMKEQLKKLREEVERLRRRGRDHSQRRSYQEEEADEE